MALDFTPTLLDETLVNEHVGKRIRRRRRLLGLTQTQLASAVEIRFQQIQKYESGANKVSAPRLYSIAQALDVSPAYFYEGLEGDQAKATNPAAQATLDPAEDRQAARMLIALAKVNPILRERLIALAEAASGDEGEQ
jgi:transcriptional regulator with XRE-family HTH domain